ncbi:MAG: DNA double-strand break repair nuclease NurA [Candidatus Nitrosotenuis sp.]
MSDVLRGRNDVVSENPMRELINELGRQLTQKEHLDVILNSKGKQYIIEPKEFRAINPIPNPKKIAFIDGGDGSLEEAPNFLITINRVFFSLFRGRTRIKSKTKQRIQFFSFVVSTVHTDEGKKKIVYDTRLFPYGSEDRAYLPSESDLISTSEGTGVLQELRLNSLARKFTEWNLAIKVVQDELEKGDMIVLDGSLQTSFRNETKYANRLYDVALQKGVIVCGLAKTSRLITEAGDPLLARISEISEDVPFGSWYVRVAEEITSDDRGFMLVAKFHPKSKFVFRFEILREQFNKMEEDEINSILSSLAANANDVSMLGYPYGAIDADRFAQVRLDELNMYRGIIMSEMMRRPEWKRLKKYGESLSAHDFLNEVSG